MEKIREKIKTRKDFECFLQILVDRIRDNKPISDNPMLDGLVIGFMLSTETFTRDLILEKEMGHVLDGTLQKLEHIVTWILNNETVIYNLL